VQVNLRRPESVAALLRDAGFAVCARIDLDPEEQVPQARLIARREP